MVDLPGITRVPVHGQPEDIYEQIATVIRHYISPPETVILNVLSATVDFPTCESIRMSQQADKRGERTLAVVTKVDKCPEGLCEKVTTDAVSIGLGYICVRNRVSQDESHEEARETERKLFQCHPLLSKLDKRIVAIGALAERLTHIQAESFRRCLPMITTQLERELLSKKQEIAALPRGLSDPAEAAMVFFKVVNAKTKMIEGLIVHGDFANFQEDKEMHCTARLDDLFSKFATLLEKQGSDVMDKLQPSQVLKMMSEAKGVGLPNFLPQSVFRVLISNQIRQVANSCSRLVEEAHKYAEEVQFQVINNFTNGYSKLRSSCTFAARNVLGKSRDRCIDFVERILEKEQTVLFTKNPMYMRTVEHLLSKGETGTLTAAEDGNAHLSGDGDKSPSRRPEDEKSSKDQKDSIWEALYDHSQPASSNSAQPEEHRLDAEKDASMLDELKAARSMKVNLIAYWRVVRNRMADIIPQEIRFSLQKAMLEEVDADLMRQLSTLNFNMAEIMTENPALAQRRQRLNNSIKVLENAVQEVSDMMDNSAIPLL